MKSKKMIWIILILFSLPLFSSCAKTELGEKKTIAVITKSTESDFWHNVQNGVNAAATEHNVHVIFEGPETEEDYITQNQMIKEAIEKKYDAIVFSAIDFHRSSDSIAAAHDAGIKVIIIDSGVDSDKIDSTIGTDNFATGKMAAAAALSNNTNGEKKCIGLVNYDKNSYNGQQRENGFREYIANSDNAEIVAAVNVNSNTGSATTGALIMLRNHPEINVIVGLNEWTTLGIGYAIKQLSLSNTVGAVGFDSNVVSIGMLETGEMDALIVQNPFAMGYLSVESASKLIRGKSVDKTVVTSTTVITKDNMFSEANQKILFPFK